MPDKLVFADADELCEKKVPSCSCQGKSRWAPHSTQRPRLSSREIRVIPATIAKNARLVIARSSRQEFEEFPVKDDIYPSEIHPAPLDDADTHPPAISDPS
jgi:hypothetical protein